MAKSKVYIWCEGVDRCYSLKPIVQRLMNKGVEVYMYFPNTEYHSLISDYLGIPEGRIVSVYEKYPFRARVLGGLSNLVLASMVDRGFSVMFARYVETMIPKKYSFLRKVLPEISKQINRTYMRIFRCLTPRPMNDGKVLVVTTLNLPFWVSPYKQSLITLMESWDHAIKLPFFHIPSKCYTWNDDLGNDVVEHQNIDNVSSIYPFRFRYLEEFGLKYSGISEALNDLEDSKYRKHLLTLSSQKIVTYVLTSSFLDYKAFVEEKSLILQICKWSHQEGVCLYIKPKPHGVEGELDEFRVFDNVIVGMYGDAGSTNMLDDDYHLYRYILLKKSNLVVNVGTTFGLEASIAGCPVLQIVPTEDYPDKYFYHYSQNPHLRKYLMVGDDCFHYGGDFVALGLRLRASLENGTSAEAYSARLKSWVTGDADLNQSFDLLVEDLVG
jgi:hypothetical protein